MWGFLRGRLCPGSSLLPDSIPHLIQSSQPPAARGPAAGAGWTGLNWVVPEGPEGTSSGNGFHVLSSHPLPCPPPSCPHAAGVRRACTGGCQGTPGTSEPFAGGPGLGAEPVWTLGLFPAEPSRWGGPEAGAQVEPTCLCETAPACPIRHLVLDGTPPSQCLMPHPGSSFSVTWQFNPFIYWFIGFQSQTLWRLCMPDSGLRLERRTEPAWTVLSGRAFS